MNDTCATTRRLLSEQIDGALTADERAELRGHLATCPTCRAFERNLRAGLAGIARLPRVSGGAHVREAVLTGVHPGGRSSWPRGWRGWTGQFMKLGGAIAAFALVAVILVTIFNGAGSSEPDDRRSGAGSPIEEPTATPEPIPTVPTSADTYVPMPCHPDQISLSIVAEPIPGETNRNTLNTVRIEVLAIKGTGGVECRLTTPMTVWVSGPNEEAPAIQGNPVTTMLDVILGAGDAHVELAWQNWCGESGPFIITAQLSAVSGADIGWNEGIEFSPSCEDDTQPSTLNVVSEADTVPVNENCRGAATMLTAIDSATGGVQIWYVVDMSTGCGNDEGGTFRLEEPSGGRLEIDGNDTRLTFTANEAGAFEWVGMLWTNWCSDIDQVKLELGNQEWGFGSWVEETPTCQDTGKPSQLTVLEAPPGDPWPGDSESASATPLPGMISEPPVCDPTTLGLTLLPMPSPALSIAINGSTSGDSEWPFCTVDANEMTVAITNANGHLLTVDGNGETFTIDPQESNGIVWHNWCGEEGPFTITVTIADRPLTLEVANGPECTSDGSPSIIMGPNENGSMQGP